MSESTFEGFVPPTKNFFQMPNAWIDICAEITNLAELKVVQYVLRHTWGYREYDIKKAITVEEFMHGRKRTDGTRMDKGTGLKSDRSVKDGIKLAIQHGYLVCEVDDTDLARIKKSYALKMSEPEGCNLPPETGQVDTTPQTGSIYPSEVQNLPLYRVDSTPRSEKDTSGKKPKKNTPERKNAAVPDAKPEEIPSLTLSDAHLFLDKLIEEFHIRRMKDRNGYLGQLDKLEPVVKTREDGIILIDCARKDIPGNDPTLSVGNLINALPRYMQEKDRIEREKAVYNPYTNTAALQRQEERQRREEAGEAIVVDSQPPVDYQASREARERELAEKEAAELAEAVRIAEEAKRRKAEQEAFLNSPEEIARREEEAEQERIRRRQVRENSRLFKRTAGAAS